MMQGIQGPNTTDLLLIILHIGFTNVGTVLTTLALLSLGGTTPLPIPATSYNVPRVQQVHTPRVEVPVQDHV